MEGVGEKKSKVAKGLVKEGFANTVEKEWIEDKLEEFGIMLCGKLYPRFLASGCMLYLFSNYYPP